MVRYVILVGRPGGIELQLPVLMKAIPIDTSAYVVYNTFNKDEFVFSDTGIVPQIGGKSLLTALFKLFKYAMRNRSDTFHVFNLGPLFLLIIRFAGVKRIVYSIRGTVYWKTPVEKMFRKALWRLALTNDIKIVANSFYSSQCFKSQVSARYPINVIYNPIDTDRFRINTKEGKRAPSRIIYAGRLVNGKNLSKWIKVAKAITEFAPNTTFEVYGDGPLKQGLVDLSKSLGIEHKVTFHGFVRNIHEKYLEADMFIFLSEYESFGNVVVESILCGLPVLCLDIPSLKEIFAEFPDFLLDRRLDIAEQIKEKMNSYSSLLKATALVAEVFEKRYSIKQHTVKLTQIYGSYGKN
jgi:glycosyltransferase involved in cell wall biosynthesis